MPKVTATFVLRLIALCLSTLNKVSSYIITIVDLCDDGEVNESVNVPEWVKEMRDILDSIDKLVYRLDVASNVLPSLTEENKK